MVKKISSTFASNHEFIARPFALVNHVHKPVFPVSVADIAGRDQISFTIRYEGLIAFVISTGSNYQLQGGVSNTNWGLLSGSGDVTAVELASNTGTLIINGGPY